MASQFKIVMLGEGRVGKTSLTLKFVTNHFTDGQESTSQASFLSKTIVVDGKEGMFNIWDTAGQERYHALNNIYYKNAYGALVVYDVNDRSSFVKVVTWVKELQLILGPSVAIVIAGNKCDLERPEIGVDEATRFADSVRAAHIITSAKTGEGVKEAFTELAKRVLKKHAEESLSVSGLQKRRGVQLTYDSPSKKQGRGCC